MRVPLSGGAPWHTLAQHGAVSSITTGGVLTPDTPVCRRPRGAHGHARDDGVDVEASVDSYAARGSSRRMPFIDRPPPYILVGGTRPVNASLLSYRAGQDRSPRSRAEPAPVSSSDNRGVNVVPFPSVDATADRPPCRLTSSWQMNRPRLGCPPVADPRTPDRSGRRYRADQRPRCLGHNPAPSARSRRPPAAAACRSARRPAHR